MMCSAGSLFVFNAYSQALGAAVPGATHTVLSYVVLVGNFGLNLGLPVGLAIDRYGARAVLAAGSLLAGAGYLWLYIGLAPASGGGGTVATMGAAQLYPAYLAVGLGSNVAYLPAFTVFKVCGKGGCRGGCRCCVRCWLPSVCACEREHACRKRCLHTLAAACVPRPVPCHHSLTQARIQPPLCGCGHGRISRGSIAAKSWVSLRRCLRRQRLSCRCCLVRVPSTWQQGPHSTPHPPHVQT